MMKKIVYFKQLMLIVVCTLNGYSQLIATIAVNLPSSSGGIDIPVSINLDTITFISDSTLSLFMIEEKKRISVPIQIEHNEHRFMHWLIRSDDVNKKELIFHLVHEKSQEFFPIYSDVDDTALTIRSGNQDLIRYNYRTVYPPAGVDSAFQRSGFIHPLWSPRGQELTQIQPSDHYHHYGIWNPWTHVLFNGDTVDFWNLGQKKGTVRFAHFASVTNGSVFSGFQVLHEHVVYKNGGEDIALNELQTVKVYHPQEHQDYYIADFTIQLNCASDIPVRLLTYRYGGFSWRATKQWNNKNSEVLTSSGKTRKDADGATAQWLIVQGAVDGDYAGMTVMSYPTNYNFPEPLRVWPEDQNSRGDMFVNFSPTKNKDWLLQPGIQYVLKYRAVVFNGKFTKEKAEHAWQYYAHSPKISVTVH